MNTAATIPTEHYRAVVESARAEFRRVENGCVFFCDRETGREMSLYVRACDARNVALALKAAREQAREFAPLIATDSLAF